MSTAEREFQGLLDQYTRVVLAHRNADNERDEEIEAKEKTLLYNRLLAWSGVPAPSASPETAKRIRANYEAIRHDVSFQLSDYTAFNDLRALAEELDATVPVPTPSAEPVAYAAIADDDDDVLAVQTKRFTGQEWFADVPSWRIVPLYAAAASGSRGSATPDLNTMISEAIQMTIMSLDAQEDLPRSAQSVDYAGIIRTVTSGLATPAPPPRSGDTVIDNHIKDSGYAPYCLRCSTMARMQMVERFFWRCAECGAQADNRALAIEFLLKLGSGTAPSAPPAEPRRWNPDAVFGKWPIATTDAEFLAATADPSEEPTALARSHKMNEESQNSQHPPMVGLHAPREQEIAQGPHLWVQHKGTELCADFYCECGGHGHIDSDFVYAVRCTLCGRLYEVATHLTLYPIDETAWCIDMVKEPEYDKGERAEYEARVAAQANSVAADSLPSAESQTAPPSVGKELSMASAQPLDAPLSVVKELSPENPDV